MRSRRSEIIGHIDHAGGGLIRGWAADLRAISTRLALYVFHDGVYLGCARAGAFREDLNANGIGDGCYGFVFHDPALGAENATERLEVIAPDARRTRLEIAAKAHAPSGVAPASEHADVHTFFRPLLEAMARGVDLSERFVEARAEMSVRIDRLFAAMPDMAVSAFAAHIAAKYEIRAAADFPWGWYLETYGVEKAVRTPLSAQDIQGVRDRLAACAFSNVGPRRNAKRKESRYQWCVHESRRLKVEDCLVDPEPIEVLRALPWFARFSTFPLSRFMRRQRRDHPLLRGCSINTISDRTAVYLVLMLLALRDVHYLGFMPPIWLDRMLAGRPGSNPFEHAQKMLFGCPAPLLSRDDYRAHIDSMGFDLSTKSFSTFVRKGHRLALGGRPPQTPIIDVQMVGPFRQSLGLSESCRRIARALQATGLGLNVVDYRVGGRPQDAVPDIGTGAFRHARINILHLNAEEVPEAMVSLPGLLGGAHTILIPYWELDRPSRAHRLGLDLVDEVWCATHFLAKVFDGIRPVSHIGMSIVDRQAPPKPARAPVDTTRRGAFTVLCVADALSWLQRKNVLGAVSAFQTAFAGDSAAGLIIKVRNVDAASPTSVGDAWREIVGRCGGDPRIQILDADLDPRAHEMLLADADCLLSLHRAEGLGLDMLDAMQLGTPVVATAYSGNMDFCNEATAWLVDYDLVPVAPGEYAFVEAGHRWAEPRLGSAVAALHAVRDDAATRARRARAALHHVQAHASPQGLAARLSGLLRTRLARHEAAE